MLATLLAALDQTIVATALPQIADDLKGFDHLSWVVTAYLLATTVDRPALRQAVGPVRPPAAVRGLDLDLPARLRAVRARAVDGPADRVPGAAGRRRRRAVPLCQAAIADLFSPRERGRYQGYIGAMWATAAIAGPLLGGTLTDAASWRWIF